MQDGAVAGFRLSPQQEHLWLQQQQSGSSRAQALVLIDGDLQVDALKAAVGAVVERHEILRTMFQCLPGMIMPLQVITDDPPTWHGEYDLGDLDAAAQAERLDALWQATSDRDDASSAGLSVTLVNLAERRHALMLSLSTLCADRATLAALVVEIERAYREGPVSLASADEPLQYADLAEWQRDLLNSAESNAPIDYWHTHAIGNRLDRKLPFQTQAQQQTFAPISFSVALEADAVGALEALAQQYNSSLRTILLACWQSLLARFTEQSAIVVGVPFDLREKIADLEGALGPFVTYLPVVGDFSNEQQLAGAVQQLDATLQEIDSWQESFSWSRIADETETTRSSLDLPFCFSFQESSLVVGDDPTFAIVREATYLARFTVQLSGVRQAALVQLHWAYDPARLSAAAVQTLAAAFTTLLQGVIAQPATPLARLPLLTSAAHARLLAAAAAPATDAAPVLLPHALEAQAARTPTAIALVAGRTELSYAELNAQANQLARLLRARGAAPDVPVAVLLPRSPALVVALLAVLKAGAAYLPLDPGTPAERLALTLVDAAVPLILTDRAHQPELPATTVPVLTLDTLATELAAQASTNLDQPLAATQLAYVLYTSGSTGRPKGVMVPHGGLAQYLAWATAWYQLGAGSGAVVHSPLSFDLTVTSLWGPLVCGRSVVLLEEGAELEALARALAATADYSLVKLTPAHLAVLAPLVAAEHVAGSTRALVIGGEALHGATLRFWQRHAPRTRLINEYGPTETVVGCCVYEVDGTAGAGAVPIGRAVPQTTLYVLDAWGQPVPPGMTGELYIGGAQVARGYLHRAALTAERFVPDAFGHRPGARLYRTGDLVRYLPERDGVLEFVGRNDTQVKIRGFRIELGEIEAVLRQHPAICDAVVVVREDNATTAEHPDQRLAAYVTQEQANKAVQSSPALGAAREGVVPSTGAEGLSPDAIHEFLKARLPKYMVPAHIIMVDALPLTANGKVDLQALPKPNSTAADTFVAPQTVVESVLADIWQQLLGVECGIHSSFFALGGHSLLAIQLMSRVQSLFQVQLSMYTFFDAPTIAELAKLVMAHEAKPGQTETIARIQQRIKNMSADDKANMLQTIRRGGV